jgi:hypothetical protein
VLVHRPGPDIRRILVPSSSESSSRACMFVPYRTVIKIPQCTTCTATRVLTCWPGSGGYLWVDRSYSRDRYCRYCHYGVHCSVMFCTDTLIWWVCLLLQRKWNLKVTKFSRLCVQLESIQMSCLAVNGEKGGELNKPEI